MVITQFNLNKHIRFYKYAHNSGPKGSPDMILSAFDVKFNETKNETTARACRLPTNPKNNETHVNNRKSTNLQKVHPPELVYPDSDFS